MCFCLAFKQLINTTDPASSLAQVGAHFEVTEELASTNKYTVWDDHN